MDHTESIWIRSLCCLLRVCAFLCAESVSVPPLIARMDIGRKRPFRGDWALCVPGSHAENFWKSPQKACVQVHAPVTPLELTACLPKGGQPYVWTQQQLVGNHLHQGRGGGSQTWSKVSRR